MARIKGPRDKRPKTNKRAQLRRRVERKEADAEAKRRAEREQATEQSRQDDAQHRQRCRDIAMMRAGTAGLDGVAAAKLANRVEAARGRHAKAGKPLKSFDPYAIINRELGAVRPASGATALDAQLPPPRSDDGARKAPPGVRGGDADQAADREAKARRARERAQRLVEQERRDREAYKEALRRHGLIPPENGYPGSNPGGLGS